MAPTKKRAESRLIVGIHAVQMKLMFLFMLSCFALLGSAQTGGNAIQGEGRPIVGKLYEYRYCRTENFPYHWKWVVSGDAAILREWTSNGCYFCEVRFNKPSHFTLTFQQRNPPGVPSVYDESRVMQAQQPPPPEKKEG